MRSFGQPCFKTETVRGMGRAIPLPYRTAIVIDLVTVDGNGLSISYRNSTRSWNQLRITNINITTPHELIDFKPNHTVEESDSIKQESDCPNNEIWYQIQKIKILPEPQKSYMEGKIIGIEILLFFKLHLQKEKIPSKKKIRTSKTQIKKPRVGIEI